MARLVRSASLTGFADLVRSFGVDPARLLVEAEVPAQALLDPELKISGDHVGRLLELAALRTGAEDFGARLAETRRLSNLGPVGLIARDQPTLRRALEVISQYQWLHNEALLLSLEEHDEIAVARVDYAGGGSSISRQAVELTVGVLVRNLAALMGRGWRAEAVCFRHPAPSRPTLHRRVFGVSPQFDHPFDGVVLRRNDLGARFEAADPAMARHAERYVEQLAERRGRSWLAVVGELIILLLPTGACSADRVAEHLGVDRRTMHRKLAAEESSFRLVLDEKRRDLAASLIAEGRSMAAVADLAGFATPSVFSHWFRRQFGQSPREFRRAAERSRIRAAAEA